MCEGETETHIHLIHLTAPLSHTKVGNQSLTHTKRLKETQAYTGRHSVRTYKHNLTCEKKQEGCRAQRNGVRDRGSETQRERERDHSILWLGYDLTAVK